MDHWLSPNDARIRSLHEGGYLGSASYPSPLGMCTGLSHEGYLLALRFDQTAEELLSEWPGAVAKESESLLTENLLRQAFEDPLSVPVIAVGTPFRLTVWEYLRRSGTPTTMTYGEVARAIGRPAAARAVGQAVGANPLAVVIPCHRVVSRGKLTGYRWGLDRKKALLAWELSRRDPLTMPF